MRHWFDAGVAKRIVIVSFPLMGTMVGNLLMMLVDRLCLAHYSQETLVASGPAVFTSMAIIAFFCSTVGVRGTSEERIDIDPLSLKPLTLAICSSHATLCQRTADYIVSVSGGTIGAVANVKTV